MGAIFKESKKGDSYRRISPEEFLKLKGMVKQVEKNLPFPVVKVTEPVTKPQVLPSQEPRLPRPRRSISANLFEDGALTYVEPTREPLLIENPVLLAAWLMPEIKLYKWQYEELMILSGHPAGKSTDEKVVFDENTPLLRVLSAANGSGKDLIVIAFFAVWLALTGAKNRIIITSASFEQIKAQTEVHIRNLVTRVNNKWGKLFHDVQFHYIIPELGSEIKLFVTDEAKRAEGYHPFPGGKMALILNEAKSLKEEIFDAVDRCTGYSYLYYISSPGPKRGRMYKSAMSADQYPAPVTPGHFSFRKVSAFDCPHIPKSHIDRKIHEMGADSPWVLSSIYAEFADYEEAVVIPEYLWDKNVAAKVQPVGSGIGIGLDLSMGGDEIYCFVREGNHVVYHFGCRIKDSEVSIPFIDKHLDPWRNSDYVFRADNGGIGQPLIDRLIKLGWRVRRTNNQSPAVKKAEFLNLGAEMYFHTKRLIARLDIPVPDSIPKLKEQLCSRRFDGDESRQGKFALEPKKIAISEGNSSPDRADSFVLCFASYYPSAIKQVEKIEEKGYTIAELLELERSGRLFARKQQPRIGLYSQMIKV